ncbi:MAG TPA: PqqD family protein, partial [Syntrophales bacterium]|nr:PqqD family protein [Syntrophales bacterium]
NLGCFLRRAAMDVRRRTLFKMVAGATLSVTGGAFLMRNDGLLQRLWQRLRFHLALNAVPTRNPDIVSTRRDRETILASRSQRTELLKLNPMAGHIWELCDGSHRVSDIVCLLGNRFEVPTATCTRDVMFTVATLGELGVLRI